MKTDNAMKPDELQPGRRVRVTQTIERRAGDWNTIVEGTLVSVDIGPTGSWYAHGQDDRLWLRRLQIRKDDGELTTLNADQYTQVELVPG